MVTFGSSSDFSTNDSTGVATSTSSSNANSFANLSTTSTVSELTYCYKASGGSEEVLYTSTQTFPVTGYMGMHSCINNLACRFNTTSTKLSWTVTDNGDISPGSVNGCDTWWSLTGDADYWAYDPSLFRITMDGTTQGNFNLRVYESNPWDCTDSGSGCGSNVLKATKTSLTLSTGDEIYVKIAPSPSGGTRLPPPPLVYNI